jgi:branched-chain amino acid transport system ATP-binding protein
MTIKVSVRGVGKAFGGVAALSDVSFDIQPGTVVGLIGPNGAGKSTLFNVMTNIDRADHGVVELGGHDVTGKLPHQIAGLGVARTFQTSRAFPHLTVRENVLVGGYLVKGRAGAVAEVLGTRGARKFDKEMRARADRFVDAFGLNRWADQSPSGLPPAAQKYVDLARAFMSSPRLLLLDEPAAGLNDSETEGMAEAIKAAGRLGITVVVVEHNMSLLMGVADNVIVLDAGAVIAVGPPDVIRSDPTVIEAYFGQPVVSANV